jgi:PIN domain nuclease of toxin-antitoxin system
MTKQERVTFVINVKRTIPYNSIPLDHKDPYTLLIVATICTMYRRACK